MHRSLMALLCALFFALIAVGPPAPEAKAAAAVVGSLAGAVPHQTLVQPALVWRDCQRIARCNGCRPVYHCRSCSYQRQCPRRGPCQWGDICVWGPYLPVAPRGVPIR
jgi:hypothetical protein